MKSIKVHNNIIVFVVVCLFAFMHAFMQSIPITTSFYFEKLFHVSSASVINLYSFYFLACIIMQIPIGAFFARYGLRNVMLISVIVAMVGFILHAFSYYPSMLVVSRLITGIGCATAYLACIYVAMNFFDNRYLVLLIGLIEAVSTAGSIVASNPLYLLLSFAGWHITNLIVVLVFVVIFIGAYLFIPQSERSSLIRNESSIDFVIELKKIFSNKAVILLILYAFLNWFIMMSFAGFWIRDYMINIHGYSTESSLMLSNIYWGAFLVSNLLVGLFTDSFKKLKITAFALSKLTLVTFLLMAIPSVFGYPLIVTFCIFAGISGVTVILSFAFIPYITQNSTQKDMITSVVNMSIISGGIVGQYAFGFTANHVRWHQIYFNNPLFSNGYYIGLWVYVITAFLAFGVFYKLSKLLSEGKV